MIKDSIINYSLIGTLGMVFYYFKLVYWVFTNFLHLFKFNKMLSIVSKKVILYIH